MLGKYRKWILIGVVIIAAFVAYTFFFTGDNTDDALLSSSNAANRPAQIVGNEIITALNQIESLQLNRDIFDSAVFASLKDRSQEIPPEPIGKANPFDPIGTSVQRAEDVPQIEEEEVERPRSNNTLINTNTQQPVI